MRSASFEIEVRAETRHGFVDVTDALRRAVASARITAGCSVAFCAHTTCSLIINELEDGVLEDLSGRLDSLVPPDAYYAHDDPERRKLPPEGVREPKNGQAHVLQGLIGGSSHAIPILRGAPALGRWQRLLLHELDEPKDRKIIFHVFGA
jgi:secondary thiamine-phosphate synthase enzyme